MIIPAPTKLAEFFRNNPGRIKQLEVLMENCRNGRCRRVHMVVIGCGDAFINRYWPTLLLYINRGFLILTAADLKPLQTLIDEKVALATKSPAETEAAGKLKKGYAEFLFKIQEPPNKEKIKAVKYANLDPNDPNNDREWYGHLEADVVFVLVPDDVHIKEARQWNRRATIVLIEKPYNLDLAQAQDFEEELKKLASEKSDGAYTIFCGLDHFYAKIFEYIWNRHEDEIKEKVGQITGVEFGICEAGKIELWRVATLVAGIIYDLLPHVLAMISPLVKLNTIPLDSENLEIKVARHADCPPGFPLESYAWLKTKALDQKDRDLMISGHLGKGVGLQDEKYLRLIGEHGSVYFELNPAKEGLIQVEKNGTPDRLYRVKKGHPEIIDSICKGEFLDQPIGAITGDEAVQILKVLTSIRSRVEMVKHNIPTHLSGVAANALPPHALLV